MVSSRIKREDQGEGRHSPPVNKSPIIPASWPGFLHLFQRDPQVYRAPFLFVHLHPARDFVERAVATAAYIIAQRGCAMPGAGCIGGDLKAGVDRGCSHDVAIMPPAGFRVPAGPARPLLPRASYRTSPLRAASSRKRRAVRAARRSHSDRRR